MAVEEQKPFYFSFICIPPFSRVMTKCASRYLMRSDKSCSKLLFIFFSPIFNPLHSFNIESVHEDLARISYNVCVCDVAGF